MNADDLKKLKEPFKESDIEWRISERGKSNSGQWAKVLAYVTNRAIQDRLDEVCGPQNWRNEFQQIPGAFLCGLSIRVNGEWITKWDGAQESNIEATKGGISGAMKRAGVQWGIGRYLYDLEQNWAVISMNGKNYAGQDTKKGLDAMKWDPPSLPNWALPEEEQKTRKPVTTTQKDYKVIGAEIKTKIGRAATQKDVDAIMANYKFDLEAMPEKWAAALRLEAEAHKADLEAAR